MDWIREGINEPDRVGNAFLSALISDGPRCSLLSYGILLRALKGAVGDFVVIKEGIVWRSVW